MKIRPKIIAGGMLRTGTPVEDYLDQYGLLVKREDLACPPPGPPFSKTRGVYEHVRKCPADLIGVLDTYHSQAGHAVARACQVLGKKCVNFYPRYKADGPGLRDPQKRAQELGAEIVALPAGRSCILFHAAKKATLARGGYMMPNALKLPESVEETAREARGTYPEIVPPTVLLAASSGTIAAGVIKGLGEEPAYIIHMGYSRSREEIERYIRESSGVPKAKLVVVDEKYSYKDKAKAGETPPWPCSSYYDLKSFRWWLKQGRELYGEAVFWNIG